MKVDLVPQLQDLIADELREHLADRNASVPDATGFSAPYSGPGGFYTRHCARRSPGWIAGVERTIEVECVIFSPFRSS